MPPAFQDLRDFLAFLEKKGDLLRIKKEISTSLEMTEIGRRLIEKDGPAVLFENPTTASGPNKIPVLINLFSSQRRIAWGLGLENTEGLKEIGKLLAFLRQPEPPADFKEAISMLPILKKVMAMKPKVVKNAPCQEIVLTGDQIDLGLLPIQTCWPEDISPLITWPIVVTRGPDYKNDRVDGFNLGIYRMQPISKNQTLMRWLKARGGSLHYKKYADQKKTDFPVAVVIGTSPTIILAATTPIPDNLSEYHFAGLLAGRKVELVNCKTIPLQVPSNAEIVLEGYVSLDDYRDEGPFGDHTGYYNSVEKFPVFNIKAITMRKDPIYLSTYTGYPPDEPSTLALALNEIFIPIIKQQFPEIVDFYLPPEGCSYRIAIVSIKKNYAGQAKRVMMGIWSFLRQFIYTKFVIVVDQDINIRDWKEVMWAVSTKTDPIRDFSIIENTPIDYLDFASIEEGLGSKVGIDATDKIYPETKREWGRKIEMNEDIARKIDLLLASLDKNGE